MRLLTRNLSADRLDPGRLLALYEQHECCLIINSLSRVAREKLKILNSFRFWTVVFSVKL